MEKDKKGAALCSGEVGDGRRVRIRRMFGRNVTSWKVAGGSFNPVTGKAEIEEYAVPKSAMTELERMQVNLGLKPLIY